MCYCLPASCSFKRVRVFHPHTDDGSAEDASPPCQEYTHPCFQRGQRELLRFVVRNTNRTAQAILRRLSDAKQALKSSPNGELKQLVEQIPLQDVVSDEAAEPVDDASVRRSARIKRKDPPTESYVEQDEVEDEGPREVRRASSRSHSRHRRGDDYSPHQYQYPPPQQAQQQQQQQQRRAQGSLRYDTAASRRYREDDGDLRASRSPREVMQQQQYGFRGDSYAPGMTAPLPDGPLAYSYSQPIPVPSSAYSLTSPHVWMDTDSESAFGMAPPAKRAHYMNSMSPFAYGNQQRAFFASSGDDVTSRGAVVRHGGGLSPSGIAGSVQSQLPLESFSQGFVLSQPHDDGVSYSNSEWSAPGVNRRDVPPPFSIRGSGAFPNTDRQQRWHTFQQSAAAQDSDYSGLGGDDSLPLQHGLRQTGPPLAGDHLYTGARNSPRGPSRPPSNNRPAPVMVSGEGRRMNSHHSFLGEGSSYGGGEPSESGERLSMARDTALSSSAGFTSAAPLSGGRAGISTNTVDFPPETSALLQLRASAATGGSTGSMLLPRTQSTGSSAGIGSVLPIRVPSPSSQDARSARSQDDATGSQKRLSMPPPGWVRQFGRDEEEAASGLLDSARSATGNQAGGPEGPGSSLQNRRGGWLRPIRISAGGGAQPLRAPLSTGTGEDAFSVMQNGDGPISEMEGLEEAPPSPAGNVNLGQETAVDAYATPTAHSSVGGEESEQGHVLSDFVPMRVGPNLGGGSSADSRQGAAGHRGDGGQAGGGATPSSASASSSKAFKLQGLAAPFAVPQAATTRSTRGTRNASTNASHLREPSSTAASSPGGGIVTTAAPVTSTATNGLQQQAQQYLQGPPLAQQALPGSDVDATEGIAPPAPRVMRAPARQKSGRV